MAQQIPPPAKGMTPQQYYATLYRMGVAPIDAYQAVQQSFGSPEKYNQPADPSNYALGQILGTVGGSALTQEALGGFSNIGSLFGGAGATGGVATAAEPAFSMLGGTGATQIIPGLGSAGGAGATAAQAGALAPGATTAGTLAAAAPIAAGVGAALATGINYGRMSRKTKAMDRGEALRYAARDPRNWLIPSGFLAAAFGDKDMYLKEHRKLLGLQKQGINVPEQWIEATRLAKGRSKQELVDIERQKEQAGQYSNVKFAESRDVADLKPQDIWGYSAWLKRFGNDWLEKYSEDQRKQIAQAALDRGLVKESHGSINVKFTPELENDIANIAPQESSKKGPAPLRQSLQSNLGK